MTSLVVFLGAGVGGVVRYAIGQWVPGYLGAAFPWATLLINVSGSAALTLVYSVLESTAVAPEWRAFLGIGLIGGYTTFSTFSYEAVRLIHDGVWERALLYVVGSVVLSLAAAILGFGLASALLRGR